MTSQDTGWLLDELEIEQRDCLREWFQYGRVFSPAFFPAHGDFDLAVVNKYYDLFASPDGLIFSRVNTEH